MHKTISYPPPLKCLLPVIYFPDGKKKGWHGQLEGTRRGERVLFFLKKKKHNLDFKRKKTYRLLNPLIREKKISRKEKEIGL
jgi:hypothetical protein